MDFDALYTQNCSGCHGDDGIQGPAPPLADPLFLAIISQEQMTDIVTNGRAGTQMPGFVIARGGKLTSEQIEVIVQGIRERWSGTSPIPADQVPVYSLAAATNNGKQPGDKDRGATIFANTCAKCHGENGLPGDHKLGGKDGVLPFLNVLEEENLGKRNGGSAFLNLVSDQLLRRMIITGRQDLSRKMPNFRDIQGDGKPLTNEQINDLVALLASWRGEPSLGSAPGYPAAIEPPPQQP